MECTNNIFKFLNTVYKTETIPTDSFFKSLLKIRSNLEIQEDEKKNIIQEKLNAYFNFENRMKLSSYLKRKLKFTNQNFLNLYLN